MDIPVGTGRPLQELSNFRSAKRSAFDGYIIRGSIFFRPLQGGFRGRKFGGFGILFNNEIISIEAGSV